MDSDLEKKRKPGRPTLAEQKKMKKEVFKLLGRGLSAAYIIHKTEFDKDTVYGYRKEYLKSHEQEDDGTSVAQTYEEERASTKMVLDRLTDRTFDRLEYVDEQIKTAKKNKVTPDRYLLDYELSLISTVQKMQAEYRAVAVMPDIKQITAEIKKDLMKKRKSHG